MIIKTKIHEFKYFFNICHHIFGSNINENSTDDRIKYYNANKDDCDKIKCKLDLLDLIHDVVQIKDGTKILPYYEFIKNKEDLSDIINIGNDQVKIRELKNKLVNELRINMSKELMIKNSRKYEFITKSSKFLHFFRELNQMKNLMPNDFLNLENVYPKFVYRESGSTMDVLSLCKYKKNLSTELTLKFNEECENINDKLFNMINNEIKQ